MTAASVVVSLITVRNHADSKSNLLSSLDSNNVHEHLTSLSNFLPMLEHLAVEAHGTT